MGPPLKKRHSPKKGTQRSLIDFLTPTRGSQPAVIQQSNTGKDPVEKANPADILENNEGNDDNLEDNSDNESVGTVKSVSGSPGRLLVVPEEELTPVNKAAENSPVLAPGEEQPDPTEHKKMP